MFGRKKNLEEVEPTEIPDAVVKASRKQKEEVEEPEEIENQVKEEGATVKVIACELLKDGSFQSIIHSKMPMSVGEEFVWKE